MSEIKRRNLYQPQQVSQGYNPTPAPDITPALRENFQRMQRDREAQDKFKMDDLRRQETMLKVKQMLENREAESLLAFSKTGIEFAQHIAEEDIKKQRAEGESLFYEDFMAQQGVLQAHDSAMAELKSMEDSDAQMANAVYTAGAPYDVVRRWRELSGHKRAAYGEAMALNAGAIYGSYLDEAEQSEEVIKVDDKLIKVNNPQDVAEFSAVLAHNRNKFFAEEWPQNLSPGLKAKAFKVMQAEDAKRIAQFEKVHYARVGDIDRNTFTDHWKNGSITAEQWRDSVKNTPAKDGDGKFSYADAQKYLVEELVSIARRDEKRADAMMNEWGDLLLNGRRLRDIKSEVMDDYLEKKRTALNKDYKATIQERERELEGFGREIQTTGYENPDLLTKAEAERGITAYLQKAAQLGLPAVVPQYLTKLYENASSGAADIERMLREQENKKNANALSVREIEGMPQAVKDKYLEEAHAQEASRLEPVKDVYKAARAVVEKHPLVTKSSGMEGRGISSLIASELEGLIRNDVLNGMRNDPQADPLQLAKDSLATHQPVFEAGLTNDKSKYYIGGGKGYDGRLFPQYLKGSDEAVADRASRALQAASLANRVANEGLTVLEDKLLVADSYSSFKKQYKEYKRTGVFSQPVISLARTYNWSPFDVFNYQIKNYNNNVEGDMLDAVEIIREQEQRPTGLFDNTIKMLQRGDGNEQMMKRLTTDRWAVRPVYAQLVPAKGGLQGLTREDYRNLAFVISAEAELGTDDVYGVAANVLTRAAHPDYPDSIYDVIHQKDQYEAVYKGLSYDDPELTEHLMSEEGQRRIIAALIRNQDRTQYRGLTQLHNMGPGDIRFSDNGNFYFYDGQTVGSGPYKGPITKHYEKWIQK